MTALERCTFIAPDNRQCEREAGHPGRHQTGEVIARWNCESYCRCGTREGHFERNDETGVWVRFTDIGPLLTNQDGRRSDEPSSQSGLGTAAREPSSAQSSREALTSNERSQADQEMMARVLKGQEHLTVEQQLRNVCESFSIVQADNVRLYALADKQDDELERMRGLLDAAEQHVKILREQRDSPHETKATQSPIAQLVLDRVVEVNVGMFLTAAIDHIEKGGNLASGQVELTDGTLVELSMLRVQSPQKSNCESSGKIPKEPQ